jgi:DNA polymerase-3 subunit epsilon
MRKAKSIPAMNPIETEIAIANLHTSGNFKVLRRLDLDEDPRFTRRGTGSTPCCCKFASGSRRL